MSGEPRDITSQNNQPLSPQEDQLQTIPTPSLQEKQITSYIPTISLEDSADYIGRILSGDNDAFSRFYEQTQELLTGYFTNQHVPRDSVDDVLQETYIGLLDSLEKNAKDGKEQPKDLGPYLFGIARNKADKATTILDIFSRYTLLATKPAERVALDNEAVAIIEDAVAHLTPLQQEGTTI